MEEAADAFRDYVDTLPVPEGVKTELKRLAILLGRAAIAQMGADAQAIVSETFHDLMRGGSRS